MKKRRNMKKSSRLSRRNGRNNNNQTVENEPESEKETTDGKNLILDCAKYIVFT